MSLLDGAYRLFCLEGGVQHQVCWISKKNVSDLRCSYVVLLSRLQCFFLSGHDVLFLSIAEDRGVACCFSGCDVDWS